MADVDSADDDHRQQQQANKHKIEYLECLTKFRLCLIVYALCENFCFLAICLLDNSHWVPVSDSELSISSILLSSSVYLNSM